MKLTPIIIRLKDNLLENEANLYEQKIIKLIGTCSKKTGFLTNLTKGGDGGDTFSNNPNKEKIRQKMSDQRAGQKNIMYGKNHTDDIKKIMSIKRRGIGKGKKPWNYGKKMSKEFILKVTKKREETKLNSTTLKSYIAFSPLKKQYIINSLTKFCKQHNLQYQSANFYIDKGIIPSSRNGSSIDRQNLTGWSIKKTEYIPINYFKK
jgi:hypothetical protein